MKILYDHQMFSIQKYGGITKYFSELMYNLPREHQFYLSLVLSDNHYLNEKSNYFKKKNIFGDTEFKGKHTLKKINYIFNQYYSKRKINENNFDIFHPTFYDDYFLKTLKKPFILTVHDLTSHKFNDPFYEKGALKQKMENVIKKANRIIAVSENTKKDVIDFFNIVPEKIDVIHHGFNIPVTGNKQNLHGQYILFVGNREGYKNFKIFINAISVLLNKEKEIKVICVGRSFNKVEMEEFTRLNIQDQISVLKVNEEGLNTLYTNALVFVYPSLYEGFGMPILEAFTNNCPVCLSNASCFPEIAADAGIYFDPNNKESILESVKKVIYDNDFTVDKVNKGVNRLKNFSWKKTAEETAVSYKKLL